MKKEKKCIGFRKEKGEYFESSIDEMITFFQKIKEECVNMGLEDIAVQISCPGDYDRGIMVDYSGSRLETDEELAERIEEDERRKKSDCRK